MEQNLTGRVLAGMGVSRRCSTRTGVLAAASLLALIGGIVVIVVSMGRSVTQDVRAMNEGAERMEVLAHKLKETMNWDEFQELKDLAQKVDYTKLKNAYQEKYDEGEIFIKITETTFIREAHELFLNSTSENLSLLAELDPRNSAFQTRLFQLDSDIKLYENLLETFKEKHSAFHDPIKTEMFKKVDDAHFRTISIIMEIHLEAIMQQDYLPRESFERWTKTAGPYIERFQENYRSDATFQTIVNFFNAATGIVTPADQSSCAICLENFEQGDDLCFCRLQCRRQFHQGCITAYATSENAQRLSNIKCPTCRSPWFPLHAVLSEQATRIL